MIIILIICLLIPLVSYAMDIEGVVNFIVQHNPELQELRQLNRNILKHLKVEANGKVGYGQLQREGTTSLERAQTQYVIGISASIPLISPAEKSKRVQEEANKERALRLDITEAIKVYIAESVAINEENQILNNLYQELQWIAKRVLAGVDYQKTYNDKLMEYLNRRKDYEVRKAKLDIYLEKILTYVSTNKRDELKEMLKKLIQ